MSGWDGRAEELGSAKCRVICEAVLNTEFLAYPEYCISSGTMLNAMLAPLAVLKAGRARACAQCHVMAAVMLNTV